MMHMNLAGYLFSSGDSAMFSRIRYYYPNFVDREAKTQQEYVDAEINKQTKPWHILSFFNRANQV